MVADAYLGQLLRTAQGAGLDKSNAEDVTQATFATFIEKAHTFDGRSHVPS
ncbi:MAG: sigma-70 family RNA polymerase sigma factor [Candidatus Latescibacterota bacterium]|nr:MAG: sigma-70 family RNA polymerase sigma factor [Candidatus Latescibacterota bacterium]